MKIQTTFLFLTLSYLLSSCSEEKDNISPPINEELLTVVVDQYSQPNDAELAFVVTDLEGEILETVEFSSHGTFDITSNISFDGELVNLYFVKSSPSFTDIEAFYLIKKGSKIRFEANTLITKTKGNGSVSINFVAPDHSLPFETLHAATDLGSRTFHTTHDLPESIPFGYTVESKLLLWAEGSNEAFYAIKDIPTNSESMKADFSDCTNPALLKESEVVGNTRGQIFAFGRPDEDYNVAYSLAEKHFEGSNLKFFYPDLPIEKYILVIFSENDLSRYAVTSSGNIPDQIVPFHVSADVTHPTAEDFRIVFEGDFDYFVTEFFNDDENVRLTAYSPFHLNQFSVADLSKSLTLPNFNSENLFFTDVKMVDITDYSEDQEYFKYYNAYPHPLHPLVYSTFYSSDKSDSENGRILEEKMVNKILQEFRVK